MQPRGFILLSLLLVLSTSLLGTNDSNKLSLTTTDWSIKRLRPDKLETEKGIAWGIDTTGIRIGLKITPTRPTVGEPMQAWIFAENVSDRRLAVSVVSPDLEILRAASTQGNKSLVRKDVPQGNSFREKLARMSMGNGPSELGPGEILAQKMALNAMFEFGAGREYIITAQMRVISGEAARTVNLVQSGNVILTFSQAPNNNPVEIGQDSATASEALVGSNNPQLPTAQSAKKLAVSKIAGSTATPVKRTDSPASPSPVQNPSKSPALAVSDTAGQSAISTRSLVFGCVGIICLALISYILRRARGRTATKS
jgi:hypothetical protein